MALELARTMTRSRPWGVSDLRPWISSPTAGEVIGEVSYHRHDEGSPTPALLLKLLFTSSPLSVQVHPDDSHARELGMPNGKTEAWYVLNARPDATVSVGLTRTLSERELREATINGTIAHLLARKAISKGDVILVPGGTIHSIGAGLVIAEIQQRSDATFRLFDFGRQRELHVEHAIAVANAGPVETQVPPRCLTDERVVLVACAHFVLERIELRAGSTWRLGAYVETWLIVIDGGGRAGPFDIAKGDAIFAQSDRVDILVGATGMSCLVAYASSSASPDLLQSVTGPTEKRTRQSSRAPTHHIVGRRGMKTQGNLQVKAE